MHFLSPEQVHRLANLIGDEWRPLILFAAYTGLRAGELGGLRVRRLDLDRRCVTVAETVGEVGGRQHTGGTKTRRVRTVPFPSFLVVVMTELIDGREPDDYVFGRGPMPLRHNNFYGRYFKPAAARLGVPELRFHDLRHTNAAMLIRAGAHPRAIMERLGHSSITVTLNTYGHLFPELSKELTDALDDLGRSATQPKRATPRPRGRPHAHPVQTPLVDESA
jgi:integrase